MARLRRERDQIYDELVALVEHATRPAPTTDGSIRPAEDASRADDPRTSTIAST